MQRLTTGKASLLVLAAISAVGLQASAAFAGGTGATNTFDTRHYYNGHSTTTIDVEAYNEYTQHNYSESLKLETLGDIANVHISFDGSKFTGSGSAMTATTPDPIAIGTYATQTETVTGYEVSNVGIVESYDFKGTTNSITAESFYK